MPKVVADTTQSANAAANRKTKKKVKKLTRKDSASIMATDSPPRNMKNINETTAAGVVTDIPANYFNQLQNSPSQGTLMSQITPVTNGIFVNSAYYAQVQNVSD